MRFEEALAAMRAGERVGRRGNWAPSARLERLFDIESGRERGVRWRRDDVWGIGGIPFDLSPEDISAADYYVEPDAPKSIDDDDVHEIPVEQIRSGMDVWLLGKWRRVVSAELAPVGAAHGADRVLWAGGTAHLFATGMRVRVRVRNTPAPAPTVEERLAEVERRLVASEKKAAMNRNEFVDHVADRIFHDVPLMFADIPDNKYLTVERYATSAKDSRLPEQMRDAIHDAAQEIVEWAERQLRE